MFLNSEVNAYVVIKGSFRVRNLRCQPLHETESLKSKIFRTKKLYLQFYTSASTCIHMFPTYANNIYILNCGRYWKMNFRSDSYCLNGVKWTHKNGHRWPRTSYGTHTHRLMIRIGVSLNLCRAHSLTDSRCLKSEMTLAYLLGYTRTLLYSRLPAVLLNKTLTKGFDYPFHKVFSSVQPAVTSYKSQVKCC